MGHLTQVILLRILNTLITDEDFAKSLTDSINKVFDLSPPNPDDEDPFESVIAQITEHYGEEMEVPGLRSNLIGMFREKEFYAFARIVRMLRDLYGYTDARLINHLKKLKLQKKLNTDPISPWIDIKKTANAIIEELNPQKFKLFAELTSKQRCLLQGFTSEQIDVMSKFSPVGINILSRISTLLPNQRSMILSLEKKESELFRDLSYKKIRTLSALQQNVRNKVFRLDPTSRSDLRELYDALDRMKMDEINALQKLIDRETATLQSLSQEMADLARDINLLSAEDKEMYSYLSLKQLKILGNLKNDHREVISEFYNLKEVLNIANNLHSTQRDLILSLRQEEILTYIENGSELDFQQVGSLALESPEIIQDFIPIKIEEEQVILNLNRNQRAVLAKAYLLGHDGLLMIRQLGPDLTNQVFKRSKPPEELSVLQLALTKKLSNSNLLTETDLSTLFEIMQHENLNLALNLSWKGIKLLTRIADLNTNMMNIVQKLSFHKLKVLLNNDQLNGNTILMLDSLNESEGKVFIDLNLKQRSFLSHLQRFNQLPSDIFNREQRKVLGRINESSKLILSRILPLSKYEQRLFQQFLMVETNILESISTSALNIFASLNVNELQLLSSFMIWHCEEDTVFTLLRMERGTTLDSKIETTKTSLVHISEELITQNQDDFFSLIAATIEILRLNEVVANNYIESIPSLIQETTRQSIHSLIFNLHLFKFSVRDSKPVSSDIPSTPQELMEMATTEQIHTMEDLLFIRWVLSRTSSLIGTTSFEFVRRIIMHLSDQLPTYETYRIIHSKSTSKIDGIEHQLIVQGFQDMMRADRYELASSFILATEFLTEILDLNDCFQLLKTPATKAFLQKMRNYRYADIESNERLSNPNIFEVCLYYNRGNLYALSEKFDESQLWSLIENRPLSVLQVMARNFNTNLITLYETRSLKAFQEIEMNRVQIFRSFIGGLKDDEINQTYQHYRYIARWEALVGKQTYIAIISEYMIFTQSRVTRNEMRILLNSFVTEEVTYKDFIQALENKLVNELYLFLKTTTQSCSNFRRTKRSVGMTCVDSMRIERTAAAAGLAWTLFLVGKHTANGDVESLGYDTLNLWLMPKIADQITHALEKSNPVLGPVVGATISNYAAFLSLTQSVIARKNSQDQIDEKIADLNIVTNTLLIAANIPAVASRIMSSLEAEITILGEALVPIGSALAISVIIASYPMNIFLGVEKLTKQLHLSTREKMSVYWRFFWDQPIPRKLGTDIKAKNMYHKYIANYLRHLNGTYDQVALSIPTFLISDENYAMDFSRSVRARYPFLKKRQNSRLFSETIEDYDFLCGPTANDAVEAIVNVHLSQRKSNIQTKALFIPSDPTEDCQNLVSLRRRGALNSSTTMFFYVASDVSIELSTNSPLDIIFYGHHISIEDHNVTDIFVNRYYFQNQLDRCIIHKKGQNFFYVEGGKFECHLGMESAEQFNTIVIRNNFRDSVGIHSIIGSNHRERIDANFAQFVDGNGGGDVIRANQKTIVKGYLDDLILSNSIVILPMNASEIDRMYTETQTCVYNKEDSKISVNGNARLITSDGYLVTPLRFLNKTHQVTRAHIRKTFNKRIVFQNELRALKKLTIAGCKLIKQITSVKNDIVLSDVGQHVFYMDKNNHEFYWEAVQDPGNLYILRKFFANVTISKAKGILDFQDLQLGGILEKGRELADGGFEITIGGLRVNLLPGYKDIKLTFDGKKYFKIEKEKIDRDWCSHIMPIVGKVFVNETHLQNYCNCFEFESDGIAFFRLEDDLILASTEQFLVIFKYYLHVHGKMELAVKLNHGKILEPKIFKRRADRPHKLVHYNVGDSGLRIYHNQPVEEHHIGYVDLKNKSIKDFQMSINQNALVLSYRNLSLVSIEDWDNYLPARKMLFGFQDKFLANTKCIISDCDPNDIIDDFIVANNASGASSWINNNINLVFLLLQNLLNKWFPFFKPQQTTMAENLVNIIHLLENYQQSDNFQLYSDIVKLARNERYNAILKLLDSQ